MAFTNRHGCWTDWVVSILTSRIVHHSFRHLIVVLDALKLTPAGPEMCEWTIEAGSFYRISFVLFDMETLLDYGKYWMTQPVKWRRG